MGNSVSSPRAPSSAGHFEEITQTGDTQLNVSDSEDLQPESQLSPISTSFPRSENSPSRYNSIYNSFRRLNSFRSPSMQHEEENTQRSEENMFQQEERPLVAVDDHSMTDAPNTTSSITPLVRRQSTLSRLSSRILPESILRGLSGSGDDTAEHEAIRYPSSRRTRSSLFPRDLGLDVSNRPSLTGSIRRRVGLRNETRGSLRRRAIRGPFPIDQTDHHLLHNENLSYGDTNESRTPTPDLARRSVANRRARLNRVRNSLPASLSTFFGQPQDRSASPPLEHTSSNRPSRVTFAEDSDHLLVPSGNVEGRIDLDDPPHDSEAIESETQPGVSGSPDLSGMGNPRRFPHGLRSRSTRLIRRGEHPPLSQVLQLAAAAIAAQLSGHTPGGNRPLASDAFDGSIQNFVQTLQDAASAQAGQSIDMNASDGELPPVNFMRVFQFPNDENGSPIASQGRSSEPDQMEIDNGPDSSEIDRSVTLVLVGVRSMPHGHDSAENGALGPSLDTLLSLPFLPPANVLRNGSSGALFRRSDGRARINPRRHSMTNFSFPAQYESQRHQRTRTTIGRNTADINQQSIASSSTPLSESPPGPHPPPSTPADIRSGYTTPSRRPSSAGQPSLLPNLEENQPQSIAPTTTEPDPNTARQRRRSDSEFARRPELSSGAARRNGVVEPDHAPAGIGRSWLIYVVGTNVSPDHPAFTMPSLFTDNPSYEDMQMLSTLLGPVKPPVATEEEIATAGGIYRLTPRNCGLVGESSASGETSLLGISINDRCLICLSEYDAGEEIRQLHKCQHVFHRECVDEWLTTGRNSCPMCRGQGVGGDKRMTDPPASGPTPTA